MTGVSKVCGASARTLMLATWTALAFLVLLERPCRAQEEERPPVGPFVIDTTGRFIGLVHLPDLIFYALAGMTVAGA